MLTPVVINASCQQAESSVAVAKIPVTVLIRHPFKEVSTRQLSMTPS